MQEKTVSFLVSIRGYDRDSENWTTVLDNAVVTRHVRCHEVCLHYQIWPFIKVLKCDFFTAAIGLTVVW